MHILDGEQVNSGISEVCIKDVIVFRQVVILALA